MRFFSRLVGIQSVNQTRPQTAWFAGQGSVRTTGSDSVEAARGPEIHLEGCSSCPRLATRGYQLLSLAVLFNRSHVIERLCVHNCAQMARSAVCCLDALHARKSVQPSPKFLPSCSDLSVLRLSTILMNQLVGRPAGVL